MGPQIVDGSLTSELSWESQFLPAPDAGSLTGQIYCDLRKGTGEEMQEIAGFTFLGPPTEKLRVDVSHESFMDHLAFVFWEEIKNV